MIKALYLLISAAICISLFSCKNNKTNNTTEEIKKDTLVNIEVPKTEYGIEIDLFDIDHGEIKNNQNLSEILLPYGISYQTIDKIVKCSDSVFDLKKIRSGNQYCVFLDKDSTQALCYFVYEHSPVDYIVFDLKDSVNVYAGEKEITTTQKQSSGVIESSLWNAMVDNKINPMLANDMSEIYAWSIDFFGLQKGDKFKIIYEEQYVDSQSVGLGNIISINFNHAGRDFYAFPFVQDSVESFYDEEGNSLRKAFLKAPLRFSRISSRFSNSRLHPVLKIRRPHHGIDYAAPVGTPVCAVGDGKIIKACYSGGAGRMVKIKHNGTYSTAYLHLSKYGKGIKPGAYVKQGDIIGYVGSSGLSTGPHLDFRFYLNGKAVDPLKVKSPPVKPVKEFNLEAFGKIKEKLIKELGKISY